MSGRITRTRALLATCVALGAAVAVDVATEAAAPAAGGTILIGSIAGTSGAYASTGVAMENGAALAVADANAKGGALGEKFKVTSYNDQASSTLSSQLFAKLVSAGAVAILGSGDTGPATVASADRLHIPNLGAVDDAGATIYPTVRQSRPHRGSGAADSTRTRGARSMPVTR